MRRNLGRDRVFQKEITELVVDGSSDLRLGGEETGVRWGGKLVGGAKCVHQAVFEGKDVGSLSRSIECGLVVIRFGGNDIRWVEKKASLFVAGTVVVLQGGTDAG